MKTITDTFKSSYYVVQQLAYSKGQFEGEKTATAAKDTLQGEFDLAKPILEDISLETNTKQFIGILVKNLETSLRYLDTSRNTNDFPLNTVLQEYFDYKREELKECLLKLYI